MGNLYTVRSRKLQDCEAISAVNFIFFFGSLLRFDRNVWSLSGVWGQIINTSSMYLFQRLGLLAWLVRKFSSTSPMYMVARAGANLVPIARPHSCVKVRLSDWKILFFRTYLKRSRRNTLRGWFLNLLRKDNIACSYVMLVYKLSMSSVTRRKCCGIFNVLSISIKYTKFLKYGLTCACHVRLELFVYVFQAFSVGPLVAVKMGLSLRGVLCTLGWKYILWVTMYIFWGG